MHLEQKQVNYTEEITMQIGNMHRRKLRAFVNGGQLANSTFSPIFEYPDFKIVSGGGEDLPEDYWDFYYGNDMFVSKPYAVSNERFYKWLKECFSDYMRRKKYANSSRDRR